MLDKGFIETQNTDWDSYLRLLLVLPPEHKGYFSGEKLVKWQKRAIREFYFRPKYILQRMRKIKSYSDLLQILLGLNVIFGHQLRKIGFNKKNRLARII